MSATWLERLQRREDLSRDDAAGIMAQVMDGTMSAPLLAGLLIALRMKGERAHEIVGFAETMRARATRISTRYPDAFDTCGTGGDGGTTFNVSTVTALVVAACGVRVAKHGNRAVSSRCGSADLLEALGVRVDADPEVVERCLVEAGIGFFFAPTFHASMRHAADARRALGVRTAFNLLGPLTNPAGAGFQLVGVPRPEMTELVARALSLLGTTRAWVVHGADGIDELSTTGHTKVSEAVRGEVRSFFVHPSDVGLPTATPQAIGGGSADENVAITRRMLDGERGAPRDIVLFNAGVSLFIAGRVDTIRRGITMAAEALDTGRVRTTLEALIHLSHGARS